MKTIYLDNNATTPVAPEVLEVLQEYLKTEYFNPSSMYSQAKVPEQALVRARETIGACLGVELPTEIIFTSCATESNNAAIFGTLNAQPTRKHIITTAVEHPAVLEVCREAEHRGYALTVLPVAESGQLDTDTLLAALRPDTALISIMHANNETGVIFPVGDLAKAVKRVDEKVVFHTDATQSVGKLEVNLSENFSAVDLLSFSGHKLHAPKGVGALYVRRGTTWRPFLLGGHQERGRRAGTENVAFIVAMAKACEQAMAHLELEQTQVRALRDRLQEALVERIPFLEINGGATDRLPNTLNCSPHFIEGEGILYELNAEGICASSGSACTSGSLDPSHVLKAMNIPFTAMHSSVRFSLSRYTTAEEIDRVIEVFPGIVARLRRISPYWDEAAQAPRAKTGKIGNL